MFYPFYDKGMYKDKNKQGRLDIDAIADQWVNLIFAHLGYKKQNKKENKNGKTKQ